MRDGAPPDVDLAQSMIVHGYPMEEICRRTAISPRQVEGLIEAYEWKADMLPLYDRRIIDSGADPETAREFYQILKGLAEGESTDPVPRRVTSRRFSALPIYSTKHSIIFLHYFFTASN